MNQYDLSRTKFFVFHIGTKVKQTGYVDYEIAHNKCKELNTDENGNYLASPMYLVGTHIEEEKFDQSKIANPNEEIEGMISEAARLTPNTTDEDN